MRKIPSRWLYAFAGLNAGNAVWNFACSRAALAWMCVALVALCWLSAWASEREGREGS